MNNSSSHHEPSPEFRAQLKREIARAARSDQLFGAPPAPARRVAAALGIAAGVVLTLLTGVVLGASASYASAAEPDAPRPTFAMRPITNALTAMGCGVTKTEPQAPRSVRAAAPLSHGPAVAGSQEATTTPAVQAKPDRARIAALAAQHQPSVVRGDTAAQYMVMILDAAENYLWSTYGSGSLFVEIGGDTRTAAERVAFMNEHRAEYMGNALKTLDYGTYLAPKIAKEDGRMYDSLLHASALRPKTRRSLDWAGKVFFDTLDFRRGYVITTDSARGGARSVVRGGGRGGIADSMATKYFARGKLMLDSMPIYHFAAMDTFAPDGVSRVNAPDGSYRIGWGSINAPPGERATGLSGVGNGQSGIQGLPSTWLSMGESYVFAPGELAPQMLRIVVVHLTPGTIWKGR